MKHFNDINVKQMNKHCRKLLPVFKRKDNSVNYKFSTVNSTIKHKVKLGFKKSKTIKNQNHHMLVYMMQFEDYGDFEIITKNIPNKRRCFHHRDRTSVYNFI